jgi:nucleoside-diphosphate-sugar epimerase
MSTVLLTGASGFLGLHILRLLVEEGYTVVATVRSPSKAQEVLNVVKPYDSNVKISYVPDISVDGACDATFNEHPQITAVIHTASPFKTQVTDPKKELLDPAIKGITGILKTVKRSAPQVTKVVITSSALTFFDHLYPDSGAHTEENWNPITLEEVTDGWNGYCASKKFSEKAFWDFIDEEKPNFTGTSVNPPSIFGPILGAVASPHKLNESSATLYNILKGKAPQGFANTYVDVRDAAKAHVIALTNPETDGKRLWTYKDFFAARELVETVSQLNVDVVDVDHTVDSDKVKGQFEVDNSRTNKLLGFKYYSFHDTVMDTARSFIEKGIL